MIVADPGSLYTLMQIYYTYANTANTANSEPAHANYN